MAEKKKNEGQEATQEIAGLIGDNLLSGISFEGAKGFKWDEPKKVIPPIATEETEIETEIEVEASIEDEVGTTETELDDNGQPVVKEDESPIKIFADILINNGLAEKYEEKDFEDSEGFLTKLYENKFKKDLDSEIEQYKNSIPEELRELFENYEEGVPLHKLLAIESKISEYSSITLEDLKEDENKQKTIVKENLLRQGLSEEKATAKVERMEAAGLLSDEAEDALENLVKYEKHAKQVEINRAKTEKDNEQKGYQEWLKNLDTTIKGKTEIVEGVKLTDTQKKQLYEAITKPVDRHPQTKQPITAFQKKQLEDPDYLIKVAYLANVLNWDFKALERSITTKVVKRVTKDATTYQEPPSKLKGVDLSILRKFVR